MRTGPALVLALALLAGVMGLERALARRADAAPPAVERLVPPAALAGRTVAAFRIETGGEARIYVRARGLWRAREAFGAVCVPEEVAALLASVVEARGTLVGLWPESAARAGLADPGGLRLSLHGARLLSAPDEDQLVRVEYGPERSGAVFAHLAGEERVLSVDRDPRRHLPDAGRPAPLVDTRVLAGCFAPGFAGFERIAVRQGASALEIESDAPGADDLQRVWTVASGARREQAITWRVGGYKSLWIRLRWEQPADPRLAAALGLDPPYATIALAPNAGEPFEIHVSAPDAANRVHLWNRATNVVGRVRADLLPLLVPQHEDFTREAGGNPWERWLAPR
ncbi:MAG: hypothetical protein JNK02_16430 [Planctomycetes bacterium]|nr:hypothetical protein [Planctomycetota bacterium]